MAYKTEWLRRMFCFCPHTGTRRAIADLIVHAVRLLRPFESESYEERTHVNPADPKLPLYYSDFMVR